MIDPQEPRSVHTPYGIFPESAFDAARAEVSLPSLMDAIMKLDAAPRDACPDEALRDDLAKLYCMCATTFCGTTMTVSPLEHSFATLVPGVASRLLEIRHLVGDHSRTLEPLERLVAQSCISSPA
jgi:hypothetical protein